MEHLQIDELKLSGDCAALRQALEEAGYTEPRICARLGLRQLADYEMDAARRPALPPPDDAVDVLIRLFLAGDFVEAAALTTHLSHALTGVLQSLGLLKVNADGRFYGTVALYPAGGLLIASDRWSWPDGATFEAPPDTVYPALVRNTRLFLDLLPDGPCERLLDLGAGTGIAAFVAARNGARQAWASDVAARCTRFAEFNRRLNGLDNVTAITSDVYDGFNGETFDRIVAHAPYMPVLAAKWVFLSGGEDGEQITRRIVEGLPRRLERGGICCLLTMGTDRRDGQGHDVPFEARVRDWLGAAAGEFDVLFLVRRTVEPQQYALGAAPYEPRPRAEAHAWRDLFARLGVTTLAYGFLVIQRQAQADQPFTVRRTAAPELGRADWQWLLAWESAVAGGKATALILDSRLHASRRTVFEVTHRLTGEGWTPRAYQLRASHPFDVTCKAEPWAAQLIALCNGRSTGRQLYRVFRAQDWIPDSTSESEFASAVVPLVSGGFVEIEGLRPPRAAE